jgi:hypothetical protein
MTPTTSRPTAASFRPHLLRALGALTNFEPYVGASREAVCTKAAQLAGYDLHNPPWEVKTKADDLYRILGFTFRNLREKYVGKNPCLTVQVPRSEAGKDDTWALSYAGIAEARNADIKPVPAKKTKAKVKPPRVAISVPQEPLKEVLVRREKQASNETSSWITENYEKLYKKMRQYLMKNRFAVSRETQQIEDHIQHFLMSIIGRNGLKKDLIQGTCSISKVCTYLRNNVYSQLRDNARRPVCRIYHGARTAKERDSYVSQEDWARRVYVPSPFPTRTRNEDGEETAFPMESMPDVAPIQQIEEKMSFDSCSEVILDMFKRRSPAEGEELAQLFFDRYVLDMTVKECARRRGINRNQAQAKLRVAKSYIEMEMPYLQEAFGRAAA